VPLEAAAAAYGGPSWSQLSPDEQRVLQPLRPDWERLDPQRKDKWRGLANRYPLMPEPYQQRLQQQMRPWAELTPDQRRAAREQYRSLRELPPDQVRQRWEQYRSLPPEARREYARRPPEPLRNRDGSPSYYRPAPSNGHSPYRPPPPLR
jgi:hypothetical protein